MRWVRGRRYRDSGHGSTLDDPVIGDIAEAHGKTAAQVMLRWGLQHGRSVIPKSTKPSRIAENIDVFDFELTAGEMTEIDRPGLREDAVFGAEVLHLALREVGVDLDLVDRRHDRCVVEQSGEVLDHEVADPDRADLAVIEQRLQGAVASSVRSKADGSAWCRISRSIWSTPSLRALLSKPCSVWS